MELGKEDILMTKPAKRKRKIKRCFSCEFYEIGLCVNKYFNNMLGKREGYGQQTFADFGCTYWKSKEL